MSLKNVNFSSVTIRALSSVYTDIYDDGVALHRFMFIFLSHCIIMHVRLLHVLNKRLRLKIIFYNNLRY